MATKPEKPANWERIRFDFINGVGDAAFYAAKHKVSIHALRKRVTKFAWMEDRRKEATKVVLASQEVATKTRGQELAEFDKQDTSLSRALRGLAAGMIGEARKPGAKRLSPTEARTIASLIESAQKIGRIALGATTENVGVGGLAGAPPVLHALTDEVKQAKSAFLNEY